MNKCISNIILIVFILFSCNAALAQRKKVGLVLGGGGAKGAAEVGVLKVLEEANIPIDYIVGTSIGSLVGGLYAIGYDAKQLDSLYTNQNWKFLLSDEVKREDVSSLSRDEKEKYVLHIPLSLKDKTPLTAGLITGQNIYNLLSHLTVGYHHVNSFMNLPIPYASIAVDIVSGKEIDLMSGSLPLAMRASMSIPGFFTPVEMGDMLLVDGGSINNFPIDVAKKMGADIVIGVDLSSGPKKKDELNSMSNVVTQLIYIMGENKYVQNKKLVDFYINPDLKGFNMMSFQSGAIDSMIVRGEQSVRNKWPELMELKKQIFANCNDSDVRQVNRKILNHDYFEINNILFKGINKEDEDWIRGRIKLKEYSSISFKDIDKAISELQGLDLFSTVEYQLTNEAPHDLIFILKEKDYRIINVGAHIDSEEIAGLLLNMSNNKKLTTKHHYEVTARLSKNPYLKLEYDYGNYFNHRFGVSYQIQYNDFKLLSHSGEADIINFLNQSFVAYYAKNKSNFLFQIGSRLDFFNIGDQLYDVDYNPVDFNNEKYINYFTHLKFDSFDNRYFPKKGGKVEVQGSLYTDNGLKYNGDTPFSDLSFNAGTTLKLFSKFYLLPSIKGRFIYGRHIPCIYLNYVGGLYNSRYLSQQISWESAQHTYLVDRHFIGSSMEMRYEFQRKLYFTAIGEYAKDSHDFKSILRGHEYWGYAMRASLDFLAGPIGIQVNYSNIYKNVGVYLYAGLYF